MSTIYNSAGVWYKVEITNRRKDIDTGQDFVRVSGYIKRTQLVDNENILKTVVSTEYLFLRSEMGTMSDMIVYRYMDGDVVEVQKVAIKKDIEGVREV